MGIENFLNIEKSMKLVLDSLKTASNVRILAWEDKRRIIGEYHEIL